MHDGRAPARADWSPERDPERRWPRYRRVVELFGPLAPFECRCEAAGQREWLQEAEPDADDPYQGWYPNPDLSPCRCSRIPGWQYALHLAGLTTRTSTDHLGTPSGRDAFGRNRQMVTAGAYDVRKPIIVGAVEA